MNQSSSTPMRPTRHVTGAVLTSRSNPERQMKKDISSTPLLPSILVVDDNLSVLQMLHDALDLWGFNVFLAKNGREGLNVLVNNHIDGILLDMDMPVMDGLTMLDELRWRGYQTPVVIMSGNVEESALCQRAKEGAQGFMHKPFSLSFLREVCATVFEN